METFFDPTRPCIGRMVVRLRFLLKLSSIRLVLASESRLSDWRVELVVGMRRSIGRLSPLVIGRLILKLSSIRLVLASESRLSDWSDGLTVCSFHPVRREDVLFPKRIFKFSIRPSLIFRLGIASRGCSSDMRFHCLLSSSDDRF